MSAAPLAPAGDLLVQASRREVAVGEEFSFTVTRTAHPAAPLVGVELVFPGFTAAAPLAPLPGGGWQVRGRLDRPGFHAFQVKALDGVLRLTGTDYFVGRDPTPVTAGHEAGYYVFLGCGDYALIFGRETHPLANWTLAQWKELVTWMGANGLNRLWTLVNGYTLAYPSH